jgi:exopolyphosphatase / guanosine-5'-triphosphate,3'-diphosphate pyrophosphatase
VTVVRAAAVDCGTNAIRLLVLDVDPAAGSATDVLRELRIVRLGEGVDATGRFSDAALERTFEACREYAGLLRDVGSPPLRFVATSASRDVANRQRFIEGVRAALGVTPEVITGDQEAELSFAGATRGLPGDALPPFLVVDIGGGSTEFVLGTVKPGARISVDIGCVRMTERHLHSDPPTSDEVAAATADVDAAIRRAGEVVDLAAARTLVGVAGTVTTVAAIALDLPSYDSDRVHHSRLGADQVRSVSDTLLAMPRAARAALAVMHPGRVDVIGAGALILRRVVDASGASEVRVSEHDILDGVAWEVAASATSAPSAPSAASATSATSATSAPSSRSRNS